MAQDSKPVLNVGTTKSGMWHLTPEQAARAAVVLVIYPDGVFGFTHHGVSEADVGHMLRRASDHILGGAIVEAQPASKSGGA